MIHIMGGKSKTLKTIEIKQVMVPKLKTVWKAKKAFFKIASYLGVIL